MSVVVPPSLLTSFFLALVVFSSLLQLSSAMSAGSKGNYMEIDTLNEFIEFSNRVNSGRASSGVTVYLNSNINFDEASSERFYPIGNSSANPFDGIFVGNGRTINNLVISKGSNYGFGLFGYLEGAIIKNFKLTNSRVVCDTDNVSYVSGIVGHCVTDNYLLCSIQNVEVSNFEISFTGTNVGPLFVGGIAGQTQGSIKDCTVSNGTITFSGVSESAFIGGIVGYSSGNTTGCTVTNASISTSGSRSGQCFAEGIVGYMGNGTLPEPILTSTSSSSSSNVPQSEYVEIVFGKKNLTKEEAIEIIREIVGDDNFEIVRFDTEGDGKRVIVKFVDVEEAKTFLNSVEGYSREEEETRVLRAGFVDVSALDSSPGMFTVSKLLVFVISFGVFCF